MLRKALLLARVLGEAGLADPVGRGPPRRLAALADDALDQRPLKHQLRTQALAALPPDSPLFGVASVRSAAACSLRSYASGRQGAGNGA